MYFVLMLDTRSPSFMRVIDMSHYKKQTCQYFKRYLMYLSSKMLTDRSTTPGFNSTFTIDGSVSITLASYIGSHNVVF